eukprot:CAMPEP_0114324360 /NCGR_PEP_ID=MMETSP0059-20121206/28458_1 /TAXON_ID=36894 /ORGANISM="Pyramimonas parkeae, Strain CCMP726" /LENGTH=70 /DNA_ID=CAMNT_0001452879 /DNA_START=275 /DNA_END=484 /DNA_ORIENTATION=+
MVSPLKSISALKRYSPGPISSVLTSNTFATTSSVQDLLSDDRVHGSTKEPVAVDLNQMHGSHPQQHPNRY